MRSTRGDVRDHVDSHESDHRFSYPFYRDMQLQSYLEIGLSREFRSRSIFDFFNSIGPELTCRLAAGGVEQRQRWNLRKLSPLCTGRQRGRE